MRHLAFACCLLVWVPACGDDNAAVPAISLEDAPSGGGPDGGLADGWQTQKDASAPDGWIWNDDAGVWIGPDATADAGSTSDAVITDAVGQDAASGDAGATDATTAAPGELGGFCAKQTDCQEGVCIGAGSAQAYCSTVGCADSGECAGIPSGDPVCCMVYGQGAQKQSYCVKQYGATQCGKQDKAPGQSCVTGGNSDCAAGAGNWCLQSAGQAVCVQGCDKLNAPVCGAGTTCNVFDGGGGCLPYTPGVPDGSPCGSNPLGGCDKYALCIANQKNDDLAYCATPCKKDADCGTGLGCVIYNGTQGICTHYGTSPVGSNCAGDRFACAKGLYCVGSGNGSAVCAPPCVSDANCTSLGQAIGASAYCAKNPGESGGICYPQGDAGNGQNCADNPYTCAPGLFCIGGYDTYDPHAYCQKSCQDDGLCPAGASCVKYSADYSGCQPAGKLGQGQDCGGDQTKCAAGLFCLGAGKAWQCMAQCDVAQPACPGNTWCMPYGQDGLGVCWSAGTQPVGSTCVDAPWSCGQGLICSGYGQTKNATCLENCDKASCPGGFACVDFGASGHWCEPVGTGAQGASCGPSAACAAGSVCVGQQGPAPFCAQSCTASSDCPATDVNGHKLWCAAGKWGGFCIPDGDLGKNAICYEKPWSCAKGLICLGDSVTNPGAYCAQPCGGFASVCAPGEKCEYLGGGDSYCMKTGTLPAGESCLNDPQGCAPDTLCVKGAPVPECVQQCGVGFPACPKDAPCTGFTGSAVHLCVPPGFVPFGTITVPF